MKYNRAVIKRIKRMEKYFDAVTSLLNNAVDIKKSKRAQKKIAVLVEYMDSGLWLEDYKCDERSELPRELKRGVLSEDGLYNLLTDIKKEM